MQNNANWIYAQQSILGSVLIDSSLAGKLVFKISAEDFGNPCYRNIYDAIRDLYTSGKPVDPVTVLYKIDGGDEYRNLIKELMQIVPTTANIDAYIEVCRNSSMLHKYKQLGAQLLSVDSIEQAESILASANRTSAGRGFRCWSIGEALNNFLDRYNKTPKYLHWFLPQIDSQLKLEFGDFCLLGGRPSSGKSAFALQAAAYWAKVCGYRVGFYSHETNREKLTDRIVSACTAVPLGGIKDRTLTAPQLQDVCSMSVNLSDAPLDLISCAGRTVAEMQAYALAKRHQIVIIDYLQIVEGPGESEYAQISAISKRLHIMCQSLGIFCLALCQLSRTRGARPSLEDLRSSGQLEQDADAVLFLHKEEGKDDRREFIIAKNKDGPCRSTMLHFSGSQQQFSYLGRGDRPLRLFDYVRGKKSLPPADALDQMEILPQETSVPFEG